MIESNTGQKAHTRASLPIPETSHLRQTLLSQTTRIVRRRRWTRRAAVGSALAVFYLAGIGTMQAWNHFHNSAAPQEFAAASAIETTPIKKAISRNDTPKAAPHGIAAQTEGDKDTSKQTRPNPTRFELICKISDRYLYRDANTVAAIRGYRRALRIATPEELKICPQRDSWLLMALKQELNEKEKRDENRGA
ncbi:MAG: hypothetical protein JXM70_19365 [Pirellulales bacterium]|nr:hypothetical protein [Pirellulales bacterium]